MNEDLQRVKKKLDQHVLDFLAQRIATNERAFHSRHLLKYLTKVKAYYAPESPARILRELRKSGKVRYTLLSRSDSLYRVDFVESRQLEMFAA